MWTVMIFLTPDWCGWYNDSILCWPPTPPGSLATIPCSLISDLGSPCHPGLARLQCQPGGDWSRATNYTECLANINLYRQSGALTPEIYPAFSLVQLLHCCALIGPELQSVEIFSCTERSYYRLSLVMLHQQSHAIKNQLVASKAPCLLLAGSLCHKDSWLGKVLL